MNNPNDMISIKDRRREYYERLDMCDNDGGEFSNPFEGLRTLVVIVIGAALMVYGIVLWVFYG